MNVFQQVLLGNPVLRCCRNPTEQLKSDWLLRGHLFARQVGSVSGRVADRKRPKPAAKTLFNESPFHPRIEGGGHKNPKSRNPSQEPQRFRNGDWEPIEGGFCLAVNEAALLAEAGMGRDDLTQRKILWQQLSRYL